MIIREQHHFEFYVEVEYRDDGTIKVVDVAMSVEDSCNWECGSIWRYDTTDWNGVWSHRARHPAAIDLAIKQAEAFMQHEHDHMEAGQ